MKPHRIARMMRTVGLILIPARCFQIFYMALIGEMPAGLTGGGGPGAGWAVFVIILWPSISLYGLSLLFPTVRVDHCHHCKYHKETAMWKEIKQF